MAENEQKGARADRKRSGRLTVRRDGEHEATRRAGRTEDESLLKQSPRPEFLDSDPWRSLRILSEFVEGFDALATVGPAVSVFGSARIGPNHRQYKSARQLGRLLAEAGYAVITGGGPGIMEAANRGAREAGAISVGLGIDLPHEQSLNDYVDVGVTFHYFFTRKVMFVRYASGFVVFPGRLGTLDEAFEAATLRQTEKIRYFPIVLFDSEYWGGLVSWLESTVQRDANIVADDVSSLVVTDSFEDVRAELDAVEHRRPRHPRSRAA